jgi:hypothetical protein
VVAHHAQIKGPVHGTTTHDNSETMSLYGYGLVLYVVDASFTYQLVEQVEWTIYGSVLLGMSG